MTRILRLLLIAVVAWPMWQQAAAQEVKPEQSRSPQEMKIQEMKDAAAVKNNIVAPKDGVFMHTATPKAASPKSETNTNSVTVFDAPTGTNQYIPVYGWYYDMSNTTSQMIYPASELEGAGLYVGDEITKLTFYTDDNGIKFSDGKLTFTIGETTTNVFSSTALMSVPSTNVTGTVVPTNGSKTLSVVFTTPLEYTGKNLFVQVINTTKGTCDPSSTDATKWVGRSNLQSTSGNAWYASYCNKGGNLQAFLPTVTIEKYVDVSQLAARDITVKDDAFFAGKDYTWTDADGTHTSYLNEPATTPEQMIAMIQKIYTDPEIPGNLKRGFASNGTDNGETNQAVYYPGVGGVKRTGNYVDLVDSYEYYDRYGWGITGNINEVQESSYLAWHNSASPYMDYMAYYAALDQQQYTPDQEGLTLLLVELKDTYVDGSNNTISSGTYDTEYDRLKAYFANTVKSVRIITQAKRTGEGVEAGTLFKIDCEKMNKFFLLAKGQLHLDHNSYYYINYNASNLFTTADENLNANWDFAPEPGYLFWYTNTFSSYDNWYNGTSPTFGGLASKECDHNTGPLFYHMFEQFSPSMPSDSVGSLDLYQNMTTNMESFPVIHDCLGITIMNHQFMLYGANSHDDDCQDIHDLMFFVPDYRMLKDDSRDPGEHVQQYLNYNQAHKPSMGLFVIKQNPITGEQIDGQETYKLHLTWDSNLLDFLPGEDGQYTLYRVITNADGTKTYQAVGQFNPNTYEYYDNVPMQQNGQQVTYVVQGQDVGKFLSLQMSNEESYIIPGLNRAEQIRIALNNDYYFSRYDAADQTNNYSNSLIANNTIGTNVKPQYIENGSQFKFWRATIDEQTGNVVAPENPFVVAEVSNWNAATGGTLTYKDWNDQTDFSSKPYGHGYHANVTTSTISVANGEVVFDGLKLYDNFSVDVSNNTHPAQYVYYVTLETAVPFDLGNSSSSVPAIATVQNGKTYVYFEAYTNWNDVRSWVWNDSENFTGGSWPGTAMERVGINGTNYVYRWAIDGEKTPTNVIFNWEDNGRQETSTFNFTNGGYYTSSGYVGTSNTSQDARSNTVSVPVYKTDMAMNSISAADVEADVTHQFPAATKFDVNARYSSRSEILGYYIYRWADSDPEQPRTIYESDGSDASPQGQAGNQGEYYTVAMNTDFTGRTENFGSNFAPVTASFEDNYVNKAQAADTYTYAPVVELYAPIQAVNLSDNSDRTDYNTYGGPQQITAGGLLDIQVEKNAPSSYSWTDDNTGKEYRYYNVSLNINPNKEMIPDGYVVAKVRVWRKIDKQYLGEQEPTQNTPDYRWRINKINNETGELLYIDKESCVKGEKLGMEEVGTSGNNGTVYSGTFGAVTLKQGDVIPMSFVVRVYFTKPASSNAPGLKAVESADGKYYIAEYVVDEKLEYQIPTSIDGVESMSQVVGVKYYNAAGVESDTPFKGVNIVVTRYSDGSTRTTKVLK